MGFPSSFSANRTFLRTQFSQSQRYKRGPCPVEKGNLRVSLSLSLSFTQITCNNEHQWCQIFTKRKETFVVIHLCSIPPFTVFWCVRIQSRLIVFQHSLEPRQQDTGAVFALRSGRTSTTCPSRNLLSVSRAMNIFQST